jgi:hypothetical protein
LTTQFPDGIEVCRRLKADRLTAGIPVILLSAIDSVEAKLQGFTLGAVDYIAKPYAAEEVLIQVKAHLTLHQQQRSLQRAVTESTEELARLNQRLRLTNESLSAEIVQRQQAERLLQERLYLECLLSETSARFVRIAPERPAEEIADCLQRILAFFEIDRCGMVRTLPGKNSFKMRLAATDGVLPRDPDCAHGGGCRPGSLLRIHDLTNPTVRCRPLLSFSSAVGPRERRHFAR